MARYLIATPSQRSPPPDVHYPVPESLMSTFASTVGLPQLRSIDPFRWCPMSPPVGGGRASNTTDLSNPSVPCYWSGCLPHEAYCLVCESLRVLPACLRMRMILRSQHPPLSGRVCEIGGRSSPCHSQCEGYSIGNYRLEASRIEGNTRKTDVA